MRISFVLLLLLAACAARPEAFTPVAVDMPVPVACRAPQIAKPQNLFSTLPPKASLADGMKACLGQTLLDRSYETRLEAALDACR